MCTTYARNMTIKRKKKSKRLSVFYLTSLPFAYITQTLTYKTNTFIFPTTFQCAVFMFRLRDHCHCGRAFAMWMR